MRLSFGAIRHWSERPCERIFSLREKFLPGPALDGTITLRAQRRPDGLAPLACFPVCWRGISLTAVLLQGRGAWRAYLWPPQDGNCDVRSSRVRIQDKEQAMSPESRAVNRLRRLYVLLLGRLRRLNAMRQIPSACLRGQRIGRRLPFWPFRPS